MQLPPLAPFFTSLTLSVVCGICARSHHQVSEDADTFTFSPVVGYLFVGVGLLFCAVPWLARRGGDQPPSDFFWHWSPIWLLIFTGAAFFFRYRVVVRDQTLTFGAFSHRAVLFSEVIDYDEIQGQRSAELRVYLKNGKHLTFSGLLGDFDELVGMVNSHMEGLPGPQHDSAAKVRDRERRQRGNRNANWLAAAGLLIVATFVFIFWRMQLLH